MEQNKPSANEIATRWAIRKKFGNEEVFEEVYKVDLNDIDFARNSLRFENRDSGGCETCSFEYSVIEVCIHTKGRREFYFDIDIDDGTSLSEILEGMLEVSNSL